jgi:hypothetical protein
LGKKERRRMSQPYLKIKINDSYHTTAESFSNMLDAAKAHSNIHENIKIVGGTAMCYTCGWNYICLIITKTIDIGE